VGVKPVRRKYHTAALSCLYVELGPQELCARGIVVEVKQKAEESCAAVSVAYVYVCAELMEASSIGLDPHAFHGILIGQA
jgi:hypothetical protein